MWSPGSPSPLMPQRLPSRWKWAMPVVALVAACQTSEDATGEAVHVPDDVACRRCEIVLDSVVTLTTPADTTDGFPSAVRVDSIGRYWLLRRGAMPALFSATGRYLRSVGRAGQGPGEYEWPSDVIPFARDSVLLIDSRSRRATVLDSALRAIRTIALPIAVENPVVFRWPDSVLVSGNSPLQGERGPLHRLSFGNREATVLESFRPGAERMPDEMLLLWRHYIATPRQRHFWTAWASAYDLSRWRLDGTPVRRLERRPSWFPGVGSALSYDWRNKPPQSYVTGIEEDAAGLVWVFLATAAPTWKSVIDAIPAGVAEYDPRRMNFEQLMRLTIEVIDPIRARVLARRTVDEFVVGAVPGVGIALYQVDEQAGLGHVRVLRVALSRS